VLLRFQVLPLAEVALGKGAARTRLQVALEADRRPFVSELNGGDEPPRLVACGMDGPARIVCGQSCGHVTRETNKGPPGVGEALQQVDESLGKHTRTAASCLPPIPSLAGGHIARLANSPSRNVRARVECEFPQCQPRGKLDSRAAPGERSTGRSRLGWRVACQPKLEVLGEARARLRACGATAGNLRVDSERRLVDQTFKSWNRLTRWLRTLQQFQGAA
jgi:hypothetical protein